jgi:hypothetical protein
MTHALFNQPWGLVAMDLVSGGRSQTNLMIASPRVNLPLSRGRH